MVTLLLTVTGYTLKPHRYSGGSTNWWLRKQGFGSLWLHYLMVFLGPGHLLGVIHKIHLTWRFGSGRSSVVSMTLCCPLVGDVPYSTPDCSHFTACVATLRLGSVPSVLWALLQAALSHWIKRVRKRGPWTFGRELYSLPWNPGRRWWSCEWWEHGPTRVPLACAQKVELFS